MAKTTFLEFEQPIAELEQTLTVARERLVVHGLQGRLQLGDQRVRTDQRMPRICDRARRQHTGYRSVVDIHEQERIARRGDARLAIGRRCMAQERCWERRLVVHGVTPEARCPSGLMAAQAERSGSIKLITSSTAAVSLCRLAWNKRCSL